MTAKFDPKLIREPKFIDDKYLSCDADGLTTVEKKKRSCVRWFFGKIIHWMFNPNERISRVSQVFESQVAAFTKNEGYFNCEDAANMLANAKYFNKRVIQQHNDRWFCAILFWNKVPQIATDKLEKRLNTEIAKIKTEIEQCDLKPTKICESFSPLGLALRTVDSIKHVAEVATEREALEKIVNQKKQQFVQIVEDETQRIKNITNFSESDFAILDQLCNICNYRALNLGFDIALNNVKELVNPYGHQHQEYNQLVEDLKKLDHATADIAIRVQRIVTSIWISDENKTLLKANLLRLRVKTCQANELPQMQDELATLGKEKQNEEVKSVLDSVKDTCHRRTKCQAILDAIQAEITARDAAHDQMGVIASPPVAQLTREERQQLDPQSLWLSRYDNLWGNLLVVRALSMSCVEIHELLNGKKMESLSEAAFTTFCKRRQPLLWTVDTTEGFKAAPALAKTYQEFINYIQERNVYQASLEKVLNQLKEMSTFPQNHKKLLSLYFWIGSRNSSSLSQQISELSRNVFFTEEAKQLLMLATKKCFPHSAIIGNEELMKKCAQAWKKAEVPQFTDEELIKLEALSKDPSIPLHFALQLDLLRKMQKLQYHPRLESNGSPEIDQLIHELSTCEDLLVKPVVYKNFNAMCKRLFKQAQKYMPREKIAIGKISQLESTVSSQMTSLVKEWTTKGLDTPNKITHLLEANEGVKMLISIPYPQYFPEFPKDNTPYEIALLRFLTLFARIVHDYDVIHAFLKIGLKDKEYALASWEDSIIPLKLLLQQSAPFTQTNFEETRMLVANLVTFSHVTLYQLLLQNGCGPFNQLPPDPNKGENQAFASQVINLLTRINEQDYLRENTQHLTVEIFLDKMELNRKHQSAQLTSKISEIVGLVGLAVAKLQIELTKMIENNIELIARH